MSTSAPIKILPKVKGLNIDTVDCCSPPPVNINVEEVAANARLLAAVADPTRLGILAMLAGLDEPLCVCQIVTQFDLGQPTISHHLRLLREAHLVGWEKRGLWVYYWLNRNVLSGITTYLASLQKAASASPAL